MLDEKTRMAVALKRFSLISPIINGQTDGITEYCVRITSEPIQMPHYGLKNYAPNTIKNWYSVYMQNGIDGLKPLPRSDTGMPRVINAEMAEAILAKIDEFPKAPATKIYDLLIEEQAFLKKDASLPTVRRYINANRKIPCGDDDSVQMLRFAKGRVNELWQTDIMYGPYVGEKKKSVAYLMGYIDDASRLITHAEFYLSQDILSLRDSFREAVLRRGLPTLLYTDNGKIYRSQQFDYLCANIGVTLLHHGVYQAHSKGKIERFFHTVRMRFLSVIKKGDLKDIDTLNAKFRLWLENDYQKKVHSELNGKTPLDVFIGQTENIKLVTDLAAFNKKFLMRVARTIKKDATISLDCILYETDPCFAGMKKVDIRYEPAADGEVPGELLLFQNDECIGSAKRVNYTDNAKRKRQGAKIREKDTGAAGEMIPENTPEPKEHTISYAEMKEG
ncbi:MAG: DDE-type integrase/transposase/recombinase [Clostridiales Family XIII bacterium]|jgi:transposase InsO family protein|nr:DDE-type integrase/transposase/recombinase [Clostridiales Family XIII bacterium]